MSEKEIITITECYKNAPPVLYAQLLKFRETCKIRTFEFNGKTVEYIATGHGEKTLVMFHGALGSADTTFSEILRLQDRYRIISPTIQDFGSLDEISDAVNEILRREHIDRILVRGGSFGAFIAQSYFRRNYKKIDRMVLNNAFPPKGKYSNKDKRYIKLFKFLFGIISEKLAKKFMFNKLSKLGGHSQQLSEEQQQELDFLMMQVQERIVKVRKKHIVESMMLVVEFDLNETMKSEDFTDWNGKILLITDVEDGSYEYFEKLKAQFPNPQVKIFEKAGHIMQLVYKSEFEEIHDKFLAN